MRLVSGFSLFLFATAFTPFAFAQTPPPPKVPTPEPSPPAPAFDATIIVEVDSGDANVQLDGQPVVGALSAKRLPVLAGHHVVEASSGGRRPVRREVDVQSGQTVGVVLHVVPLSEDAIGYDAPQEEEPAPGDHGTPRLPLILLGAGVSLVALGLGIGFNLAANASTNDAVAEQVAIGQAHGTTSSCANPSARFAPACTSLHQDLVAHDLNGNISVAAYATAGVAAAATIAYVVWARSTAGSRRGTAWLRPAPLVGPSMGGLAVAGVF